GDCSRERPCPLTPILSQWESGCAFGFVVAQPDLIRLGAGLSVATARDDVGFVEKPEPVMLAQNLSDGIEITATLGHFGQPVIFDWPDIPGCFPGCKGGRGSDRAGDLVWQRLHIITEDRAVIGIGIKVKVAPCRTQLIFYRAQ